MPEYSEPQIKDYKQTCPQGIRLRWVKAFVDMPDQILQAGANPLHVLGYCGDQQPPAKYHSQQTEWPEELEEATEENKKI